MHSKKERLLEQLKNKEYRDAFVAEMISTGIPFQLRALRKQRNWSQQKMSEETGMMQERISVLEDPNYGKLTLTTLKKVASALNIGLLVRFVPISDLVKWELKLSSDSLKASSYDDDPYFKIKVKEKEITATTDKFATLTHEQYTTNNLIDIRNHLPNRTISLQQQNIKTMSA